MVKIIVTGHGEFPSGVVSALKLIVGNLTQVSYVNFLESDSTEDLRQKLKLAMSGEGHEILVLADLLGGSPFKEAVMLQTALPQKRIEVLAGMNLPMLLTAVLTGAASASDLADILLLEGQAGMVRFKKRQDRLPTSHEDWDEEEGI